MNRNGIAHARVSAPWPHRRIIATVMIPIPHAESSRFITKGMSGSPYWKRLNAYKA